jgi:hypothetical protein
MTFDWETEQSRGVLSEIAFWEGGIKLDDLF